MSVRELLRRNLPLTRLHIIALLAVWISAARASEIDPLRALRAA